MESFVFLKHSFFFIAGPTIRMKGFEKLMIGIAHLIGQRLAHQILVQNLAGREWIWVLCFLFHSELSWSSTTLSVDPERLKRG